MPARTLWIPYGLYRLALSKMVDVANNTPFALLKREPLATTVYVTPRLAEHHGDAFIVDAVHFGNAEGRLRLRQEVGEDNTFRLHCEDWEEQDFEVKLLPLSSNVDLLARCGAFMSAAIELLRLSVPQSDSDNLKPLNEFQDWWTNPVASLPDTTNWEDIAPWIREEFEKRQALINNLWADQPDRPMEVPSPQCYQSLLRELFCDEDLSRALVNKLSAQRNLLDPQLSDCDLVSTELTERVESVFRNSPKYLDRCLVAGNDPNWLGAVFIAAWRSAQHSLQRSSGVPRQPQLPLRQCGELLEAIGITPVVGGTIDGYVREYLANRNGTKASAKIAAYYSAKRRFALAHDYLAQTAITKFMADGLTPDNLLRARLGLLASIDHWCHHANLVNAADMPSAFAFQGFAAGIMAQFLRTSLSDMVIAPEDRNILARHVDDDKRRVDDDNQNDTSIDHSVSDELRAARHRLRAQFKLARLSHDEKVSVLFAYEMLAVANQEEAKATCAFFGISWPLSDNHDQRREIVRTIIRKLKRAAEKRLPNGALLFLIREAALEVEAIHAVLYRYDIVREDLNDAEKEKLRTIFGIEPCMKAPSDNKLLEKTSFKKLEECRTRIASNGRLSKLFRKAKLQPREAQAVLCALRIVTDTMQEPKKQKIRDGLGIEPESPDVADKEELETLWNRAFGKLNGVQ